MPDGDNSRPQLAEPREIVRVVANPLGEAEHASPHLGGFVSVEQQRAIAEVQARMLIARANPRSTIRCVDQILQDCTRPTLAETAIYQYARGGTSVSGPSIRLAEAIARRWGNIAAGIKEISRSDGYSECVAYAWDLETGYYDERQFQVRHWRDTKKGGYQITDERDIYELIANMGQRRKRAVLLSVIPGDVVEAAVSQCEETMRASADASPEAIKKMIAIFRDEFGVSKAQIEARCQCRAEAIRPAQLVQLRKIYTSLRDGMSAPGDWFAPVQIGELPAQQSQPRRAPQQQQEPEPQQEAAGALQDSPDRQAADEAPIAEAESVEAGPERMEPSPAQSARRQVRFEV